MQIYTKPFEFTWIVPPVKDEFNPIVGGIFCMNWRSAPTWGKTNSLKTQQRFGHFKF